jgi:hypothetical protein
MSSVYDIKLHIMSIGTRHQWSALMGEFMHCPHECFSCCSHIFVPLGIELSIVLAWAPPQHFLWLKVHKYCCGGLWILACAHQKGQWPKSGYLEKCEYTLKVKKKTHCFCLFTIKSFSPSCSVLRNSKTMLLLSPPSPLSRLSRLSSLSTQNDSLGNDALHWPFALVTGQVRKQFKWWRICIGQVKKLDHQYRSLCRQLGKGPRHRFCNWVGLQQGIKTHPPWC